MEEEKKPQQGKLEAFFAGKGFYMVLLLCLAVIGVSAWSMLSGAARETAAGEDALAVANLEEPAAEDAIPVSGGGSAVIVPEAPVIKATPRPTVKPAEPSPAPTEAPAAAAEPVPAEAAPVMAEVRDYYIWPVAGEIENGYSMTALVFNRTLRDWRTHDGLDIAAEKGTQVRAAANGRVTGVYDDDLYGTTVVLSHNGGLTSVYANLAATPTVSVGDQVGVGQVIGAVGDTALCEIGEVSHLHFAMTLDGESVDPTEYMP